MNKLIIYSSVFGVIFWLKLNVGFRLPRLLALKPPVYLQLICCYLQYSGRPFYGRSRIFSDKATLQY